MGAVRWIWVGAIALAVVAAAVVVFIARGGESAGTAAGSGAGITTSLDQTSVEFGDPVTATVAVTAPRGTPVTVDADLAPLTQLGRTRVTLVTQGSVQTVTYATRASCLDDRCITRTKPKQIELRPAVVHVGGRSATAVWPALTVQRRVSPADAAKVKPPLRADTTPPAVTYDVSPDHLALALDIAAAILAAAGVLLAGASAAALYRRRRRAAPLTGLERALALAREAEQRPEPDRRRALGLLARLLGQRDGQLAGEADELAWSAAGPTPGAVSQLVTEVEQKVSGG
jgi:hypothetical protein